VDEQLLFIGVSKKDLNVEQTANPVNVILILLSPKAVKAEEHLKGLNTIVKLIRQGKGVEELKNAKTAQEVIRVLNSKQQPVKT
jgi:mannitol/fructose-specific phosphotransferase system IIA component (Ntr-type)